MFKKILVPLDGFPLAESILPQVAALARQHSAELVVLRVARAHNFPWADPTEAQVEVLREAEKYLGELEQRLKGQGLRVSSVVRYGDAAEEILDHTNLSGVDLIAMSTHGRTGVSRWVLGSVAEKVLRHSTHPLLLVRAPGVHPERP